MKQYSVKILSQNSPVLIGRFMLIFSRRKIEVTNFSYTKMNEEEGNFSIDFLADEWMAENIQKQLNRQIDVYETSMI
jgi:acetolactate synthase regulatory subunit